MPIPRRLAAALVALSLMTAACGDDDSEAATEATTPTTAPTTTTTTTEPPETTTTTTEPPIEELGRTAEHPILSVSVSDGGGTPPQYLIDVVLALKWTDDSRDLSAVTTDEQVNLNVVYVDTFGQEWSDDALSASGLWNPYPGMVSVGRLRFPVDQRAVELVDGLPDGHFEITPYIDAYHHLTGNDAFDSDEPYPMVVKPSEIGTMPTPDLPEQALGLGSEVVSNGFSLRLDSLTIDTDSGETVANFSVTNVGEEPADFNYNLSRLIGTADGHITWHNASLATGPTLYPGETQSASISTTVTTLRGAENVDTKGVWFAVDVGPVAQYGPSSGPDWKHYVVDATLI